MASTQQRRDWWSRYRCNPDRMQRVAFPVPGGKIVKLLVAVPSVPVWTAVSQIMESEPYLFRESSGGTYNCRPIGSSGLMSLHAYGIALDVNPSKNPHKAPLTTDMPSSFIKRIEGIRANGKKAVQWGGRWSKPDAMHFEIDVAPADCENVTWDKGGGSMATWKSEDGYTYTDVDDWGQFTEAIKWNINNQLLMGRRDKNTMKAVFDPNVALQRDEAASMLFRIAKDSPTFKKEIED